jgi:ribosomal protein S18 acetylase RimI-like enzyme
MTLFFRDNAVPSDRDRVMHMVKNTGFFNPEEELIALDLVNAHLENGPDSGYLFLFCQDRSGTMLGYTCYGRIPGTASSYDLYWIVVDKGSQRLGIGRQLLAETEALVRKMGGTRIYIETSSRELYRPTRAFYRKSGYLEEAELRDFYAPGDSKIIFVKELA